MQAPNFDRLRRERADCHKTGERCCRSSYASGVHPNPRFYKYYWWIFWNESPVDGKEFLTDKYRLSTAAAIQLLNSLSEQNEPCWLYNKRLPRHGSAIPFDAHSTRWKKVEWAPAYDEDADPIADGKWLGHK